MSNYNDIIKQVEESWQQLASIRPIVMVEDGVFSVFPSVELMPSLD